MQGVNVEPGLTNAGMCVTVNTIRLHMGTAHMACDPLGGDIHE